MEKLFDDMASDEQINWAVGCMLLAIGRGEIRATVWSIMSAARRSGYAQGKADYEPQPRKKRPKKRAKKK